MDTKDVSLGVRVKLTRASSATTTAGVSLGNRGTIQTSRADWSGKVRVLFDNGHLLTIGLTSLDRI